MAETNNPVTPIEARRAEVAQYQANVAMYQSIASTLPTEYPEHLEQYRNVPAGSHQTVITQLTDIEDITLLSDLWMHDQCVNAIKTETLEMRKALAILTALES